MKLKQTDAVQDNAHIEILPLMDVIFCILTFFILGAVGLTRQQAIEQSLPQATTGQQQMRDMFRVSIDPIGRIFVDRDPVTMDELPDRLRAYQAENPDGLVVVFGHPMAQYNNVIQVLDLLRSIGGDRVSLGVNPSQDSPLDRNPQQNPFGDFPVTPEPVPEESPLDLSPDPGSPNSEPGSDSGLPSLEPEVEFDSLDPPGDS
ncbi:ExbD/TolR family protein [Sodalinema gerasimenkoae]|uniref:ExbD/TolR family protein n=1 Tax=Sodalinema gerasimenkoae TaxID=2862348 RepID=UPI001356B418|nr:biopolymer transporter ExbD [Sodalinema gerasimenkoae]